MLYFWVTIALVITAVHILLALRAKRFKRQATQKYHMLIDGLKHQTLKKMKQQHLYFDRTFPIVSDTEEPFLICLDSRRSKISFTDSSQVKIFDFHEIQASELEKKQSRSDNRFYKSVKLHIWISSMNQPITVIFGENQTKKTSSKGKFLTANAERIHQIIQEIIADNQLQSDA